MKKISLRNVSFVGLFLMGASAVTAAIMPSKADDKDNAFAGGSLVVSSSGDGGLTVVSGLGAYSHTQTGAPRNAGDGLSATSADNVLDTGTHEVGISTAGGTTIDA